MINFLARLAAPKVLLPLGVAVAAASGFAGYTVRGWQCEAAQLEAVQEGGQREDEAQNDVNSTSSDYELERQALEGEASRDEAQVRVIYRTVPSPALDCEPPVSARGVLEQAAARANASASGEPRG